MIYISNQINLNDDDDEEFIGGKKKLTDPECVKFKIAARLTHCCGVQWIKNSRPAYFQI